MIQLLDHEVGSAKPEERRRWPRIAARNRITIVVVAAPSAPMLEGRRYCCWTEDLSACGVRFCVHSPVPLSSVIKMDVQPGDSRYGSFRHVGRVVWEQEFEKAEGVDTARWLGVEIVETMGGDERAQQWFQMLEEKCASAAREVGEEADGGGKG